LYTEKYCDIYHTTIFRNLYSHTADRISDKKKHTRKERKKKKEEETRGMREVDNRISKHEKQTRHVEFHCPLCRHI
jgi:DNA-binding protein H-NS